MKNRYKIDGDKLIVYLDRRDRTVIECVTDADQLEKLMTLNVKWCAKWAEKTRSYYVQANKCVGRFDGVKKYTTIYMHKVLMDSPKGNDVDHVNHDTLDNRLGNLKCKDRSENSLNRTGANRNNKTGVRNVSLIGKRYVVTLFLDGQHIKFGSFKNLEEAAKVAEEARKQHYKTA